MARVNTHVHVVDPDGNPVVLVPGKDVPEWAPAVVSNPDVWDEAPAAEKPARRARSEK